MKDVTGHNPARNSFQRSQKRCGRCGVAMKKNQLCPACRKFFVTLSLL